MLVSPSRASKPPNVQPTGTRRTHGSQARGRHRLRHQHHPAGQVVGLGAHSGAARWRCRPPRRCRPAGAAPAASPTRGRAGPRAGSQRVAQQLDEQRAASRAASTPPAAARPGARSSAGSGSASAAPAAGPRNSSCRSRPCCRIIRRSCEGMVSPRVAANASAISSSENCRSARSYTVRASLRSASTSIMLARSTACRHGDGPHLGEGGVDELDLAVEHHQVGRLDVAVRDAGLPQPAHDQQALVDHRLVHLGLADLDSAPVEELGDQQVLPLRGDLHDAVRLRHRQPGRLHQPQHVVLVLDQPADRVERLLVLQPAVEQGAAELVPAVRAQVGDRVELREQVRVRVALDA